MNKRHSAAFDRAVRIELLRAKASMQRQSISIHAQQLCQAADPRRQVSRWLASGKAGKLGLGIDLLSRYPFLLSTISTALTTKRWGRVMSVVAIAGSAWWFASRSSGDDQGR